MAQALTLLVCFYYHRQAYHPTKRPFLGRFSWMNGFVVCGMQLTARAWASLAYLFVC